MIIHLDRIGEVEFLRELLGKIVVTSEVAEELISGPVPLDLKADRFKGWISVFPPRRRPAQLGLGRGEASLLLAARKDDRLVLDDLQARAVAEARGLDYVGLLGLIVAGAQSGKIERRRALTILNALVATEFRLAPGLYAKARREIEGNKV